jgi:hypothetical protein
VAVEAVRVEPGFETVELVTPDESSPVQKPRMIYRAPRTTSR